MVISSHRVFEARVGDEKMRPTVVATGNPPISVLIH